MQGPINKRSQHTAQAPECEPWLHYTSLPPDSCSLPSVSLALCTSEPVKGRGNARCL